MPSLPLSFHFDSSPQVFSRRQQRNVRFLTWFRPIHSRPFIAFAVSENLAQFRGKRRNVRIIAAAALYGELAVEAGSVLLCPLRALLQDLLQREKGLFGRINWSRRRSMKMDVCMFWESKCELLGLLRQSRGRSVLAWLNAVAQVEEEEERGENATCAIPASCHAVKSPSLARCWDAPTSRALGVLRPAIAVPTSSCEAGGASGSPAKKSPCEDLLDPQISVMMVAHSQTNPPNDSPRSTRPAGRCRGSRSTFSLSMPACLFAPARGCAGPPQLRRHRIVASFLMGDRGGQGPRSGSKPAGATRRCSRQATTRRGESREGNACRQARRRVRPSPRKFKFKCSSKAGNQRSCNARTLRVLHR